MAPSQGWIEEAAESCDECVPDSSVLNKRSIGDAFLEHTVESGNTDPESPDYRADLVAEAIVFFVKHGMCWYHAGVLAQPLIEVSLNTIEGVGNDGSG